MEKTFRTVYLSQDLERRLQKLADSEESSVSRMVRIALKRYLEAKNLPQHAANVENRSNKKAEGGQENG